MSSSEEETTDFVLGSACLPLSLAKFACFVMTWLTKKWNKQREKYD